MNERTRAIGIVTVQWTLAGMAAMALTMLLEQPLADALGRRYAGWIAGGMIIGAAQWLVLRGRLHEPNIWLVMGLPWPFAWSLLGYFAGALPGLAQWTLALQGQVRGAIWWMAASVFAWYAAWLVGFAIAPAASSVISWMVIWAIYGLMTGPVLGWLLTRPIAGKKPASPASSASTDGKTVHR